MRLDKILPILFGIAVLVFVLIEQIGPLTWREAFRKRRKVVIVIVAVVLLVNFLSRLAHYLSM